MPVIKFHLRRSQIEKRKKICHFEYQVRYGDKRRSSASPRPFCDGSLSASIWPSPRQTLGPPCPNPSDRAPPDATMKRVDAPSAWSSPSDCWPLVENPIPVNCGFEIVWNLKCFVYGGWTDLLLIFQLSGWNQLMDHCLLYILYRQVFSPSG